MVALIIKYFLRSDTKMLFSFQTEQQIGITFHSNLDSAVTFFAENGDFILLRKLFQLTLVK